MRLCNILAVIVTAEWRIYNIMISELSERNYHTISGELTLIISVIINSFGVVLMLYSGAGISAISSVPYAFSRVFSHVSLGTWTYIFRVPLCSV